MDVDNEVLIALVFDKPPLWDKRNKFHSNRNVTDKYWKEISLEMKQDENKLRKRWRYLRDQFTVELGKIPPSRSGDDALTVCPKWAYFKPLLFLKAVVKARATTGSLTRRRSPSSSVNPDGETGDSQSTNDNVVCASTPPRNTEDDDASDQPTVSTMSAFKTASKRHKNTLDDQILEFEYLKLKYLQEKEKSRQNRTDADNEHMLFFKSLLPHIEKIPRHRVLSFRNRIQSVVEEFAYESWQYDNQSTSNYSYSNVSCHSTPENKINLAQFNEATGNIVAAEESTSNRVASEECNESTQSVQNDQYLE